jgi:hypothetical protein
LSAGRHLAQPQEVFHCSSCITAGMVFSPLALISRRTSSWPRSVHLHTWLHGGRVVAVAEGQRHQLLDKPGAGTAGSGRLGMRPHIVERGQPLRRDGRRDLALADAVAAADFRIIRQCRNGRHRVQRRSPLIGLAEDQRVAHLRDVGLLLLEVVEPGAVARLAVEHRADDAVVLENEPLVDAGRASRSTISSRSSPSAKSPSE